ncbi:MAG: hypothetical protein KC636_10485 [Myxococcales bacterium]|nr:hypothetical protein [Myxococcales bacterium]
MSTTPIHVTDLDQFTDRDLVLESAARPGHFLMPAGDLSSFEGAVAVFQPIDSQAALDAARLRLAGAGGTYELKHAGAPLGHHGWTGKFGAAGGRAQQLVAGLSGAPATISMHQGIDQFKVIDYWRIEGSRPYGERTFTDALAMTDRVGVPTDDASKIAATFRLRLASEVARLVDRLGELAGEDVVIESVAVPGHFLMPAGDTSDFEGAVAVFRPIDSEASLDNARIRLVGGGGTYELQHARLPIGHHGWTGKFGAAGGRAQQVVAGLCGDPQTISMHQGIDQFKVIDYWRVTPERSYGDETFANAFIMTDRVGEPTDEAGRVASSFRVRRASDIPTVPVYRLYASSGDHLFTNNPAERDLRRSEGWSDDGEAFRLFASDAPGRAPLYRLYGPQGGAHIATSDADDRQSLIAAGWSDEGILGYLSTSEGAELYSIALRRDGVTVDALVTLAVEERDARVNEGWDALPSPGYITR